MHLNVIDWIHTSAHLTTQLAFPKYTMYTQGLNLSVVLPQSFDAHVSLIARGTCYLSVSSRRCSRIFQLYMRWIRSGKYKHGALVGACLVRVKC